MESWYEADLPGLLVRRASPFWPIPRGFRVWPGGHTDGEPGRCTDTPGHRPNFGFGHRSRGADRRWLGVRERLPIAGGSGQPRAQVQASGQGASVSGIPYPRSASSFPRGNPSPMAGVAQLRRPRRCSRGPPPVASLIRRVGRRSRAGSRRPRGRHSPDRRRRGERASPRQRAADRVCLPGTARPRRRLPGQGLRPARSELRVPQARKDRRPGPGREFPGSGWVPVPPGPERGWQRPEPRPGPPPVRHPLRPGSPT